MILNDGITETSRGTKKYWFHEKNKDYSIWIEVLNKQIISDSCTCRFGSFDGHAKRFKGKKCTHVKQCVKILTSKGILI